MRVVFVRLAFRQFQKFNWTTRKQIDQKLNFYLAQPNPLHFADKLRDSRLGSFRFRVGDYRILFDIQDDVITILKIGHRKDVYK